MCLLRGGMYIVSVGNDDSVKIWNPHLHNYRRFICHDDKNDEQNINGIISNNVVDMDIVDVYDDQGWCLCALKGDGFALGTSKGIKIYRKSSSSSSSSGVYVYTYICSYIRT